MLQTEQKDEMVPKVKPVAINNVVYMPSFGRKRNSLVSGHTLIRLADVFTAKKKPINAVAVKTAFRLTRTPALRK